MSNENRLEQAYAMLRYIGEQLRGKREELGLSIEEASKKTEIPCEEISKIENGQDSEKASDTWLLGFTYGMDVAKLFTDAINYCKQEYGE